MNVNRGENFSEPTSTDPFWTGKTAPGMTKEGTGQELPLTCHISAPAMTQPWTRSSEETEMQDSPRYHSPSRLARAKDLLAESCSRSFFFVSICWLSLQSDVRLQHFYTFLHFLIQCPSILSLSLLSALRLTQFQFL